MFNQVVARIKQLFELLAKMQSLGQSDRHLTTSWLDSFNMMHELTVELRLDGRIIVIWKHPDDVRCKVVASDFMRIGWVTFTRRTTMEITSPPGIYGDALLKAVKQL